MADAITLHVQRIRPGRSAGTMNGNKQGVDRVEYMRITDSAAHHDRIARESRRKEHLAHDDTSSDTEYHGKEAPRSRSRSPNRNHAKSASSHHIRQHWQRQHSDRPDGVNMDTCNGHSILMSTAERGRREPSRIRKGSQRKMLPNVKLTPAQLVYRSGKQYKDILIPILNQELKYQRCMQMSQTAAEVEVKWTAPGEVEFSNPWQGVDKSLCIGAVVHLTRAENGFTTTGKITSSANNVLRMSVPGCAMGQGSCFQAYIKYNSTPFQHMKRAIKRFANCRRNAKIRELILGQHVLDEANESNIPLSTNFSDLGSLNESQNSAIRRALSQPLSLIQGPPGTGKTVTSASLVHFCVARQRGKVLVCAPSNTAVMNICKMIAKTGLNVVQVCSKAFERHPSTSQKVARTASKTTLQHKLASHPRYCRLMELKKDSRRYCSLKEKCENEILKKADVVCCTCVTAACRKVSRLKFEMVVIDECGQATEPECMIPIALCAPKKVVLIGDQCQLGPIVMDEAAARADLRKSLFERLIELGMKPVLLNTQYRMHPILSTFPSHQFYGGCLQDGVTSLERTPVVQFPWPDFDKPTFFWDVKGQEECSINSHSFSNIDEAVCTLTVLRMLLENRVEKSQIGIITPYTDQKGVIKSYLTQGTNIEEIEIDSVDAFQGREKDYIIFTCVRSNQQKRMGFLSDQRRLNVALTRARRGLIIIGNTDLLSQDDVWRSLIQHYSKHHLLIRGDLKNGTYIRI